MQVVQVSGHPSGHGHPGRGENVLSLRAPDHAPIAGSGCSHMDGGDRSPDVRKPNRHRSVLRLAKNVPVQSSAAANAGGYWSFPRTAESYARSGYTCAASDGAQSGRSMVMPKSGANRNPNRP